MLTIHAIPNASADQPNSSPHICVKPPGVSRRAAIADNGLMLIGGLDDNSSLPHDDVDVEGT